jgi:hypothetical protein
MLATLLLAALALSAQQKGPPSTSRPAAANADRLGMTCTQILALSSTDWLAKYGAVKGSDAPQTIRALGAYGKCYDERTNELAASLGKSGKGPLMGALGNFRNLEQALQTFTKAALADSDPPADALKGAYAALYEKQFRYEFYESYAPKPPAAPTDATKPAADTAANSAPAKTNTPAVPNSPASNLAPTPEEAKASNANPVTQAKNHFGELLGNLPDDQMHELHRTFGEILGPNDATSKMQLLVYRYAIFLLEPPGSKPFAPPPF